MAVTNFDQGLQDLYEAADLVQLRGRLTRHLVNLGFWWVAEHRNCLRVTKAYASQGKYIWDNLSDQVGDRRSDLIDAIFAAFLSQGVEEQNYRLRWLAMQTRPYFAFSDQARGLRVHREFSKALGDFGFRGPSTLVVPLPDGGAGRHRLWACTEDTGALRNANQAIALMMAYNHMRQLLAAADVRGVGLPATIGDASRAGSGPDPVDGADPANPTGVLALVRRSATRDREMRAHIEEHLHDPELGVAQLCRTFAMSRRTIYRMFAADGGVARYVIERRLARAFGELSAATPSRGLINAVALSCGFDDLPRFSRLFRQKFGVAPSDAVGLRSADHKPARPVSGPADGGAPAQQAKSRVPQHI